MAANDASDDEEVLFDDEDTGGSGLADDEPPPWPILIVDDDQDVHDATLFALRGASVFDRPLRFLHAYSARECVERLREIPDVAVIILDVVMETESAGLDVVALIRHELNLTRPRIILRTGQPGYAPEIDTIRLYDINDYKTKNELTQTRLLTTLTAAIRSFDQICRLDASRLGLERIVAASNRLISTEGVQQFSTGVIAQIAALIGVKADGVVCVRADNGHCAENGRIIAAAGQFAGLVGRRLGEIDETRTREILRACLERRCNHVESNCMGLFFPGRNASDFAAFIQSGKRLHDIDEHLLDVFCHNIAICADNVSLIEQRTNALNLTRAQLVESDKMASIGQLAAGVAEDIQAPIGGVFSGMVSLEQYFAEVLRALDAYESSDAARALGERVEALPALRGLVDVDFVRSSMEHLIADSRQAITRVRHILADLHDLADERTPQAWAIADLNAAIESAISLAGGRIRSSLEVRREFGRLPDVECLPGPLKRVFLNLIVNAAQAMGNDQGVLTIRTGTDGEQVWLEFSDTGCGMTEEIRQRVFEPFFTTKPVGQGTGVGLPWSKGVIDAHHGKLEVSSSPGAGATFRIALPLRQAAPGPA